MKYLLPFVALFLLAACDETKKDEPLPPHAKMVQLQLADSLGIITMAVPERYDTSFSWIHYTDCGDPCADRKYRFQPKGLRIFQESGFYTKISLTDTIDKFTIKHPLVIRHYRETDTSINAHISYLREQKIVIKKMGISDKLVFDTIQKINDRYYTITVLNYSDSQQRKEVSAFTIISEAPVEFKYELLSAKKDSITDNFIPEALSLIKTIRIHGERTKKPSR
ncbi:hypothetical protein HHL17_23885 [Chitinophaga sp. G-6-1-13]|uniref:Lipoprotein n=1 Tax=Chitinophaga fulva TaxID=2728842 RepID=A0A848GT12_9BACT|nr:hypothetical protein [Chitinophaga fulva]NML40262.1 hypothetical protein [Chitinophaga fulva]